jgi:RsiW-degrading membrane proteinase PrsW (M82 family)
MKMMTHQHHEFGTSHLQTDMPSNRSFGNIFTIVFSIYAGYMLYGGRVGPSVAGAIAAVIFLLAGRLNAAWLTPLNKLWMKLGLLLSLIVAPIALGILFFLVITPIGLLARRVFGKHFLSLRREDRALTYWIDRNPPGPAPKSMQRQF